LQHIHWHAQSISRHTEDGKAPARMRVVQISKFSHIALIDSLIRVIEQLSIHNVKTEWMDYYSDTNYSAIALKHKQTIFASAIQEEHITTLWDLGANDGHFSRIALENGAGLVVAFDIDPLAVEKNYGKAKDEKLNMLPLLFDLTNPSPGIGFANKERLPVDQRMKPDCIVALAIIHHLAISNNLPLEKIAEWMASLTDLLIIEFVPKQDTQVQILLATRCDIFSEYHQPAFEKAFEAYFPIVRKEPIQDSLRTIYVFKKGL
jgi:ribosomal protein L11 methylase PrmA